MIYQIEFTLEIFFIISFIACLAIQQYYYDTAEKELPLSIAVLGIGSMCGATLTVVSMLLTLIWN